MDNAFSPFSGDDADPFDTGRAPGDRRNAPEEAGSAPRRLAKAVGKLFRRDDSVELEDAGEEVRDRALFDRIGAFLFENGLCPSPAHYELAHIYVTEDNRALVEAVNRAIARENRLTAEAAELILAESRSELTAGKLGTLVDEAQAGLKSIANLVKQSGADAQAYGDALESNAAVLEDVSTPRESLAALLDLTRSMIQKTREAEQQLRQTGKRMTSLRSSLAEARRVAESDALTGLANRRAFDAKLSRAIAHAHDSHEPLALAFCDIDHFKVINDTHGHDVGDRILRFVAARLSAASGNNCYVARHGGEEFVMLFENMDATAAMAIVDECRSDLATRRLVAKQSGNAIGHVTFSAGVAQLYEGQSGNELLRNADRALYRAKKEGRDRVLLAEPLAVAA
jgi:diguanylate cyclase